MSTSAFYQSPLNPTVVAALLDRLQAAERVILDAENNLGMVNPLLVDSWRDIAGLPSTKL